MVFCIPPVVVAVLLVLVVNVLADTFNGYCLGSLGNYTPEFLCVGRESIKGVLF